MGRKHVTKHIKVGCANWKIIIGRDSHPRNILVVRFSCLIFDFTYIDPSCLYINIKRERESKRETNEVNLFDIPFTFIFFILERFRFKIQKAN